MDIEQHGGLEPEATESAQPDTQHAHNQSVLSDVHEVLRQMQEEGRGEITDEPKPLEPELSADDQNGQPVAPGEVEQPTEPSALNPIEQSLDRWAPVMEQVGVQREQVVDNYMAAVVGLKNDPVGTITQIAQAYLTPDQAQQALAALSNQFGVDPYDVDVDSYREKLPQQQRDNEIAQLRAQMLGMQINNLRASGNYPLLNDEAATSKIAATMGKYADMSIEQAYTLAVHTDPDLSAKHAQAVAGETAPSKEAIEKERQSKLRRARAADLPRGASGERTPTPTGNKAYDDVRAIALELGFGSN